jgi:hypothetical protein
MVITEASLRSASVMTGENLWGSPYCGTRQLHPLVEPQVSHLRQVPLRTRVKLPHS